MDERGRVYTNGNATMPCPNDPFHSPEPETAEPKAWTLTYDDDLGREVADGPALDSGETVEVVEKAGLRNARKAVWDQKEAELDEYRRANTDQKHRIRELEAERDEAREKLFQATRARAEAEAELEGKVSLDEVLAALRHDMKLPGRGFAVGREAAKWLEQRFRRDGGKER